MRNTTFNIFNIFSFCNSFMFSGSGSATNVCLQNIGTDGTYWLYDSNTVGMGTPTPGYTLDGTFFYAFKCDAAGNFIIQWGDAGDEQLTDVDSILVYNEGQTAADVAKWNDATDRYEFVNTDWSARVITEYNAGVREVCFSMKILPSPFIHYTFSEILKGGPIYVPPVPPNREINLVNNTGEDVHLGLEMFSSVYVLINGVKYDGQDDTYISILINDVDIKIEYYENTLTYLSFNRNDNPYYSDDLSYKYSEVFASTALLYCLVYGQPSDNPIDMSHLVAITEVTFGGGITISNIPDEWKTLPATLIFFGLEGCPNLDYVDMITYYPNVSGSNQGRINSTNPIPNYTRIMDWWYVIEVDAGSFLNTSFNNISYGVSFMNCSLPESEVDRFLQILVDDGKTSGYYYIDNSSNFIGNLNAAPSTAGEANIDILRTNGCEIHVEGGY